MDFLYKFQIINHHQYGFRKNHSTFMVIFELVNGIYHGFENNMLTDGVFLDLKKAFDTVNHDILIDKMSFYGFRGNDLSWIKSYFSERSQYVEINNVQSSPTTIKCGVPQGSVLGPLLFIVFINDIFNTIGVRDGVAGGAAAPPPKKDYKLEKSGKCSTKVGRRVGN
jgi:retron-type reverse transcriptase